MSAVSTLKYDQYTQNLFWAESTWNMHSSTIHVWNNDKVKTAAIPKPQMKFGKADLSSPGPSPSLNLRPRGTLMSEGHITLL